ncbi:MAG: acyl-CoA dehydrogenase family protein [Candidatus Tectomicrobia bacterium]|uniref:Acyl-CoA dehydrogenase family protein n=1 Tax=Tectimicrobiota bacterium TaxID=2528274 RepID=A0A932I134_UNCTE|nr:acyl-CoA dehydrogenase family protein [Candidatus Tectomicrobia bacterium]
MDFSLTEEQLALQRLAHEFAEREIRPVAKVLDQTKDPHKRFPWDILEKGSRAGLRTLALPEAMGGAGADVLTLCLVGEELAWGDLGVAVTFDQTWKITHLLERLTNEEQRARYLPRFLEDHRFHLAVAMTEPSGGTDNILPFDSPSAGVRTTAVRNGNDWVVNGTKHFISNGGIAKLYFLAARTDPSKGVSEGLTYFIVTPDMAGFSIGAIHDKMGQRLSLNAELIFQNCRVPDANRVTAVNEAMKARRRFVRGSNIEAAATVLGTARAAYEDALEYARNRVQGGKPIIEHQAVGFMLCDCFAEYEASRRLLHYAAWTAGQDSLYDPKMGFMTKCFVSEASFRIATRALEVWGGMGYMTEAPMEKYLRDVTSFLHSDGTNQAMRIRSMNFL